VGAQTGERLVSIDELTFVHLLDALANRLMQRSPLVVIHVFALHGVQVDHLPLRQVGRFVEDEAPVVDVGFERLHRFESLRLGRLGGHDVFFLGRDRLPRESNQLSATSRAGGRWGLDANDSGHRPGYFQDRRELPGTSTLRLRAMLKTVLLFATAVANLFRSRRAMLTEMALLRCQLTVLQRAVPRPRLSR